MLIYKVTDIIVDTKISVSIDGRCMRECQNKVQSSFW